MTRLTGLLIDERVVAAQALQVEPCRCVRPLVAVGTDVLCGRCGREWRPASGLSHEYRTAAYAQRLSWAAGEGLCRRTGFRGLAGEVGANPDLDALQDALEERVAELELERDEFTDLMSAAA